MAEVALKKLKDQLNCIICMDTYTDPKQLQCHHVYCRGCLMKLVERDEQELLVLPCPTCRQVTPVPANGVAGLQAAFQTRSLLEIVEEHKKAAAMTEKIENSSPSASVREASTVSCREHCGEEVELFCATCEKPICLKCVVKSGTHHGHDTELLCEAFEKYKREITASLEPMERQLTTINKALAQLDARCREIADQQAATEANIHDTFKQLHKILDARKTQLINQLHHITQRKLKSLAVQRDQIETLLAQLSSCLDYVKESLDTSCKKEVLMMKATVVNQVKELTTAFQPNLLKTRIAADTKFSSSANFSSVMENYCRVSTAVDRPDPMQCRASGKGLGVAIVGEKAYAALQVGNFKGHLLKVPVLLSECELVSDVSGSRTQGSVERKGYKYRISYRPTIKGRHQLHVKVEGQHIRGSPFDIAVMSPVEKLSTPILTIANVIEPWGVTINQRGEVVVTEMGGHCVSVFSPSGERLRSFGTRGSGQGQFECPAGVAVDSDGNIFVVDCLNHRVQKFSADGQFLAAAGTVGHISGLQFLRPKGITINNSSNKIYVVDTDNSRVQVLNSDLTLSSTFKLGSDKGQPFGAACDRSGNVYVADTRNRRIQVFTAKGEFLRMFAEGVVELKGPSDIAIASTGTVYVTDDSHRMYVFTSEGQLVTSFSSLDKGFSLPVGVAVDSSGVVYVCDHNNSRVQLF